MINRSIHREDIINIYTLNKRATKYRKQPVTKMKEKMDNLMIIFEVFNTTLSKMDRTIRQNINKEIEDLNNSVNQLDITDIYRTTELYSTTVDKPFFSSAHGTFYKTTK